MSLKVELKPGERIIIGECVITNTDQRTRLLIDGQAPILRAAPSTWAYIESINNHILTGELYKALKDAKKLIAYEGELLDNAKRGTSVRVDSEASSQSA
jgi:flagellar protein FlbT